MKSTTIIMHPTWGKTLCLLEENKSVRIPKNDKKRFKNILNSAGYNYECSEDGELERFTLINKINMKIILVTIQEFLANGGNLEVGREIYREDYRHFDTKKFDETPVLKNTLLYGEYIGRDEKQGTFLVKNASFKSLPLTATVGYVRVEVEPIYK